MSEWILVKDKLPPYEEDVLVYRKFCGRGDTCLVYHGEKFSVATYCRAESNIAEYYQKKGDHTWDYTLKDHWTCEKEEAIVAWMPIPELPQEVG